MMDNRTNQMTEIPKEFIQEFNGLSNAKDRIAAGEAVGIPEKHQGAVLSLGEELDIKGSKFKITSIKPNRIILQPVKG